jgi:hypothetical protein
LKYFKDQFEQEVDAEGEIEIRGQVFTRTDILSTVRDGVYDLVFEEWLEERIASLIDDAEAILEKYDAAPRFERLCKAYSTSGVIPFVGAGLSASSGYPAWTKTLFQLRNHTSVSEVELQSMIDAGDYEEAAQRLHDDMGASQFNERIEAIFGADRSAVGPVCLLPQVFARENVLTTNFDGLLEKVYEDDEFDGFDEVEYGHDLSEVVRQIASGTRLLVKIHGHCSRIASRVLLRAEYDRTYCAAGTVTQFFSRALFGKSMLFLGCGLSIDRTIRSMANVVATHGADTLPRHYAFLELKSTDDRVSRERVLAMSNIFPIWYPEGAHSSIEALLVKLYRSVEPK